MSDLWVIVASKDDSTRVLDAFDGREKADMYAAGYLERLLIQSLFEGEDGSGVEVAVKRSTVA